MANQQPSDSKPDLSKLPRGAISIKGLPINRNSRLPSIRSPRDLTLGAQPKRTFVPNIPVRKEKRSLPENQNKIKIEETVEVEKKSPSNDKFKGRVRGRGQLIQLQGSLFGEGLTTPPPPSRKERQKEPCQRNASISSKKNSIKKEDIGKDITHLNDSLSGLLRDDFIDDDDEDDEFEIKHIAFPIAKANEITWKRYDDITNKDLSKIKKNDLVDDGGFIKREDDLVLNKSEIKVNKNDKEYLSTTFKERNPKLFLLQFPECLSVKEKNIESEKEINQRKNENSKKFNSPDKTLFNLPEGKIGKLKFMKSGKIYLTLNSLEFVIEDNPSPLSMKTELVSHQIASDGGNLTMLGTIDERIIISSNV